MFREIELWKAPAESLRSKTDFICEMDGHDHAFLCGMIRHKNPRKLLEIGIAEGGTTAVIIKCLSLLGSKREVYSVDLNSRLYCDKQKKTGYEYDRLAPYIDRTNVVHQVLLGKTVAEQIERIGSGIDFVVLDTTHRFPGEILDFLCVLPWLSKNAVVVLHDIHLNYIRAMSESRKRVIDNSKSVATKLLFSAVTADKYLPIKEHDLPNIAAFTVSEGTYEHIEDLFYLLSFTWAYMPPQNMLAGYKKSYEGHYDKRCLELYDRAVAGNQKMLERMELARSIQEDDMSRYRFPYSIIPPGSRIVLYGAGTVGKKVYKTQKRMDTYRIVMWTDKKYKEYREEGMEVDDPSNIQKIVFDYIVVAVEKEDLFQTIRGEILKNGWDAGKPIMGPISRY